MTRKFITCCFVVSEDDDDVVDEAEDAFGFDTPVLMTGNDADEDDTIDLCSDRDLHGMFPHNRCSSVNIKRLATPPNNPVVVHPSVVLASRCNTKDTQRRKRRCSTLSV